MTITLFYIFYIYLGVTLYIYISYLTFFITFIYIVYIHYLTSFVFWLGDRFIYVWIFIHHCLLYIDIDAYYFYFVIPVLVWLARHYYLELLI